MDIYILLDTCSFDYNGEKQIITQANKHLIRIKRRRTSVSPFSINATKTHINTNSFQSSCSIA